MISSAIGRLVAGAWRGDRAQLLIALQGQRHLVIGVIRVQGRGGRSAARTGDSARRRASAGRGSCSEGRRGARAGTGSAVGRAEDLVHSLGKAALSRRFWRIGRSACSTSSTSPGDARWGVAQQMFSARARRRRAIGTPDPLGGLHEQVQFKVDPPAASTHTPATRKSPLPSGNHHPGLPVVGRVEGNRAKAYWVTVMWSVAGVRPRANPPGWSRMCSVG